MKDPRLDPVPGAEIEVLGKNKSSRRIVRSVNSDIVCFYKPALSGLKLTTCTLAAWRKWAFNGHIVSRGQE